MIGNIEGHRNIIRSSPIVAIVGGIQRESIADLLRHLYIIGYHITIIMAPGFAAAVGGDVVEGSYCPGIIATVDKGPLIGQIREIVRRSIGNVSKLRVYKY